MDVSSIYALRPSVKQPLPDSVVEIFSKLRTSFRPVFRRPVRREPIVEVANWRQNVLVETFRKVREKDDPDYDEINAAINKLSKPTYSKLTDLIKAKIAGRDAMFRLRVTTLLFDRGIRQNFYASMLADLYSDIVKLSEDARADLMTQVSMFDSLYDTSAVTIVPSSSDAGFDDALIAWTKQKETKRGFAVYTSELYSRGLIPESTMTVFVVTVVDDLRESITHKRTPPVEEHVDHLVRFLVAVAPKVREVKPKVTEILAIPRTDTPSLTMKSRFKLEDVAAR
uniref:MIF4G domain-containing protein n=1 Tax=viral metagenome TaxID=1070528 RepID=A0A6C0AJS2_9ZZZZ